MNWVISAYGFGIGLIGIYAFLLTRRRIRIQKELARATAERTESA